jgi:hypothetical protein
MSEAWQRWRGYVFETDQPLTRRERQLLARAAADECCDRSRVDQLAGYVPESPAESWLEEFARKLTRQHAIAVVALQNAEWRLAMGRLVSGC